MAETPSNPLEFVTTREMVDELARRSSGVVLGVVRSIDQNQESFECWYRGGFTQAVGIGARIQRDLLGKEPDGPGIPDEGEADA